MSYSILNFLPRGTVISAQRVSNVWCINMPSPYKCVNVIVKVSGSTIGVVESLTMELEREGGVEPIYGTEQGKHAVGGKRATFTVRRWFMADSDTDLFIDLFDDKTRFELSGEISGIATSKITLSDCLAYRYRPVYGAPNDKVGEELSGEATTWTKNLV